MKLILLLLSLADRKLGFKILCVCECVCVFVCVRERERERKRTIER